MIEFAACDCLGMPKQNSSHVQCTRYRIETASKLQKFLEKLFWARGKNNEAKSRVHGDAYSQQYGTLLRGGGVPDAAWKVVDPMLDDYFCCLV